MYHQLYLKVRVCTQHYIIASEFSPTLLFSQRLALSWEGAGAPFFFFGSCFARQEKTVYFSWRVKEERKNRLLSQTILLASSENLHV